MSLFRELWTPITGATGRERISVSNTIKNLTIPDGASGCRIQVIGDATNTDSTKAVICSFQGTDPSTSVGMTFGDLDIIELTNKAQMTNFKALQYEASKTNNLEVVYYYEAK